MTTTKPARIPSRNGLTAYVFADAQTLGTVLGGLAYVVGEVTLLILGIFTGGAALKESNPFAALALALMVAGVLLYAKYSTSFAK